jgi:hypothetical protein
MISLEDQFQHAMLGVYENAKQYNYYATYFKQMIDQHGGLGAAKRLLEKEEIQEGLIKLWELGQLGKSMEALVVQERFQPLFSQAEINEARRRLTELGFSK